MAYELPTGPLHTQREVWWGESEEAGDPLRPGPTLAWASFFITQQFFLALPGGQDEVFSSYLLALRILPQDPVLVSLYPGTTDS